MSAAERGYTNTLVYLEGMPVWEERGYPIITGPEYEAKIEPNRIPAQNLGTLLTSDPGRITVVDVRDEYEYAEGHIPGAINIPVASFASQSSVLEKNKTIVVYCNGGGRSYLAYRKLMKLGYKNFHQALFADWKEAGLAIER